MVCEIDPTTSKIVAKILLRTGAVIIRPDYPFMFRSGLRSPIYCDSRLIISYPDKRKVIAGIMVKAVREMIDSCNIDTIAGTASSGIPWAAWVADELNLPMVYIRERPKEHGVFHQLEGRLGEGQKVVVIEDLISTGFSSISTANVVREHGGSVEWCLSIMTYQMAAARKAFGEDKIQLCALCDARILLQVASEMKLIEAATKLNIKTWLDQVGQE